MFRIKNTIWAKGLKVFFGFLLVLSLVIAPIAQQTARATGWPTVDSLLNGTAITQTGTGVANLAKTIANWVLKILANILMQVAKVLLNKLTEATVNWINGGFEGNPKFVENPKSFFKNIGDTQLSNLIDTVGYNASKFPYGRQISQALIGAYKSKNSADLANGLKYTLTDIVGDQAKQFEKDFKVGGWKANGAYYQNPANNAFGSLFAISAKSNKKIDDAAKTVKESIDQGKGFLNQRKCTEWRKGPEMAAGFIGPAPAPIEHTDANCTSWKTTSPGSVVQDQISKALGSKFTQSELGAALGNSLSSIINALTTQLLNKGLSALSTALKPGENGTPQQTWSYNGETLDASNTNDQNDPANWSLADQQQHLNELFYSGENIGITDEEGNPQKLTLIEQAYLEAEAYRKILGIMNGTRPANPTIGTLEFCTENPDDPACTIVNDVSLAKAIRALDYKIPGPKYGWRNRLTDTLSGGLQKWTQKASSIKDTNRQKRAEEIADALQSANDEIPVEIELQLLTGNIPSYTDAVGLVKTGVGYNNHIAEYTDNYTKTLVAIARLKGIKNALDDILTNFAVPSCISQSFCNDNPTSPACTSPSYNYCTTHGDEAACIAKNYCSSQADVNLEQFITKHTALSTISTKHLNNYPNSLPTPWRDILSQPPLVNPFTQLSVAGQQLMKKQVKAYALINQDLPNSGTISSAQNAAEQVAAEFQNIGFMLHKVESEISNNALKFIYKVRFHGYQRKFVESLVHLSDSEVAALPQSQRTQLQTTGYVITDDEVPPTQVWNASILAALGTMVGIPPSSVMSTMVHNVPVEMLINSLGGGEVPERMSANVSNFNFIPPVTQLQFCQSNPGATGCSNLLTICQSNPSATDCSSQMTQSQIFGALQADPWLSDDLDEAHKNILTGLSTDLLNTLYSLVITTEIIEDLGEGWDAHSTGHTRLEKSLDVINDADSVTIDVDSPSETPGKIFYCQSILDKHDNRSARFRGGSISLFKRRDVRLKCDRFYDSKDSDYTKNQI